jgi:hypothetical protein
VQEAVETMKLRSNDFITKLGAIDEVLRLASYYKTLGAKQIGLTRFSLDRWLKTSADAVSICSSAN